MSLKMKKMTMEQYRKLVQDMKNNPNDCYCEVLYEWEDLNRSDADEIVSTFKYHGKYDFYKQYEMYEANMRVCSICGKLYSDAPWMA